MNRYLLAALSLVFVFGSCDFTEAQLFRRRVQRNQFQNYNYNYNYQPALQQASYYQPAVSPAAFPVQQPAYPVQQASFTTGAQPGFDSSLPFNPHDVGYMGPGTMRDHLWSEHSADLQARGISQDSLMSMSAAQVQSLHNQFHGSEGAGLASFNQPMIQQNANTLNAYATPVIQPITYAANQTSVSTSVPAMGDIPNGMQAPSTQSRATYELEPGEVLMWEQPIEGIIMTPATEPESTPSS